MIPLLKHPRSNCGIGHVGLKFQVGHKKISQKIWGKTVKTICVNNDLVFSDFSPTTPAHVCTANNVTSSKRRMWLSKLPIPKQFLADPYVAVKSEHTVQLRMRFWILLRNNGLHEKQ
jgi:hypothetical protein